MSLATLKASATVIVLPNKLSYIGRTASAG